MRSTAAASPRRQHQPLLLLFLLHLLLILHGMTPATSSDVVKKPDAPPFLVEGVAGGSVALPCTVDPPPGDRVAVILWYKENHPDALYTYDARSPGRHQHSSRAPGLRATFHPMPPARLHLPRATTKMAGHYECRVDYLHAPSATTKVQLTVVELPESVHLETTTGRRVENQLTGNMGEELHLLCKVLGGRPKPRVWWTLGDKPLVPADGVPAEHLEEEEHPDDPPKRGSNLPIIENGHRLLDSTEAFRNSHATLRRKRALLSVGGGPRPYIKGNESSLIFNHWQGQESNRSLHSADQETDSYYSKSLGKNIRFISNDRLTITGSSKSVLDDDDEFILRAKVKKTSLSDEELENSLHMTSLDDESEEEESSMSVVTVDVHVSSLQKEHHGLALACHASNNNLTQTVLSAAVQLVVNMPPSSVSITGLPASLKVGGRHRVWCSAHNARPAPVLLWTLTRRGQPATLLARQDLTARNVSRSWVELTLEWQDDGAALRCSAHSPALPALEVTNDTTLDVKYGPRVHLSLGSMLSAEDIKEGMDVYFHCDISSNPEPSRIAWFHNGQEVQADTHVLVSGDHLVLQRVHRKWSGGFACAAHNTMGDATSTLLHIAVQYAPVCSQSRPVVYRAGFGEDVSLLCRVLANPPIVTFSWTFTKSSLQASSSPGPGFQIPASIPPFPTTSSPVASSRGVTSSHGLEGRLEYVLQRPQDYGNLECTANNSVGRQSEPCVFAVRPADIPNSDFDCKVTKQTWGSVEISCSLPLSSSSPDLQLHYNGSYNILNQKSSSTIHPANTHKELNKQIGTKALLPNKHLGDVVTSAIPNSNTITKLPTKEDKWLSLKKEEAFGVKGWGNQQNLEHVSQSETSAALQVNQMQQPLGQEDLLGMEDETRYQLTVWERDSDSLIHNTTGAFGQFNLTGLTPGADYVIKVWRVNRRGRSAPRTIETFTLRTAENRMREESGGSDPALLGAILATVGLLLVVTCTVLLIALRGRHSQHFVSSAGTTGPLQTSTTPEGAPVTSNPEDGESPTMLLASHVTMVEQSSSSTLEHDNMVGKTNTLMTTGFKSRVGSQPHTDEEFLEHPGLLRRGGEITRAHGPASNEITQYSSPSAHPPSLMLSNKDAGLFYHNTRTIDYNALIPVSSVNTSNNSTLSHVGKLHNKPVHPEVSSASSTSRISPAVETNFCHDPLYGDEDSHVPICGLGRSDKSSLVPLSGVSVARELERLRGVTSSAGVRHATAGDYRTYYVRSQQTTQVATQERESFL